MTVRREIPGAGLRRTSGVCDACEVRDDAGLSSALRQSREALADIEGQLDALLAALRTPGAAPDGAAPDRLRSATRRAGSALAALGAASAHIR